MGLSGTGNTLGDALYTAVVGAGTGLDPAEQTQVRAAWRKQGVAIVGHDVANSIILPGTFQTVDSVTGPEPVTGTGTVS